MISGIGISEVFLISFFCIFIFDSKDLPVIFRHLRKVINAFKNFMAPIHQELSDLGTDITNQINSPTKSTTPHSKIDPYKTAELRRKELAFEDRYEKSRTIAEKLTKMDEFNNAKSVMIYESVSDEVCTSPLITHKLRDLSKQIIVPYCNFKLKSLGIAHVKDAQFLEENKFGILEPKPPIRDNFNPEDIDFILIPGVCFDVKGYRIGGHGYYDNFINSLKSNIPIIGLAFECQVTSDSISTYKNTLPIDILITEKRTIYRNDTFYQKTVDVKRDL